MATCNCNNNTPETNANQIGLNMCVGLVEIGGGSITQEKVVNPTTNTQVITPDKGYDAFSSVTIQGVTYEIDPNIIASNIKEGVTILGVTGTFKGDDYAIEKFYPFVLDENGNLVVAEKGSNYEVLSTVVDDGGEGYQINLLSEVDADFNITKAKIAIPSQFNLVGVKGYEPMQQKWVWLYGSAEESLKYFVFTGETITANVEGKTYNYNVYEHTNIVELGDITLRFYTELPTEV